MVIQRLLVPLLAFALCAASPAPGAFSLDQVMSAPFASGLLAAPRGSGVAWIENEQGRRNIWVASGPEWKSRQLTNFKEDDGQEIAGLAWSPDATYLLFTRGGDSENGGENPNPASSPQKPDQAIWRAAIDGNAVSKIATGHSPQISPDGRSVIFVKNEQIYSLADPKQSPPIEAAASGKTETALVEQKGSQSDLRWASDSRFFAFVSERSGHSFIGVYTVASRTLRYLDPSVDHDSEPVWSPDSSRIAFLRMPVEGRSPFFSAHRAGTPWSVRVADVKTGAGREIFRASEGPGSVFHELDAAQQLFWTGADRIVFPWERTGWNHLYSLAIVGGSAVELTPGEGEVEHAATGANGETIYFSTNIGDIDRRHIASVATAGNESAKSLTSGESIAWQPQPAADGSALAYLSSSYNQRSHTAILLPHSHARTLPPEAASPNFPSDSLVKPQPVTITAADGLQIHGQLFLPPKATGNARHPALVFFHGGSRRQMLLGFHYMYYYSNAYSLNQYLAIKGYVVLSVNYRSGIGYGLNFREAINYGARGGSEFNDVIGAGLYLKSRADVDPARIGVWGGSYGGYLTAMALSRASDLFAAGVDFHGVHDWSNLRGYLTAGSLSGDERELAERREAARIAFESSPLASVDTWRSPVLLIHGDDDRNVEFRQTEMLVEALRKRGVHFEELIFPNEIHDFLLHRHWLEAYRATAEFFDRQLGGSELSGAKERP